MGTQEQSRVASWFAAATKVVSAVADWYAGLAVAWKVIVGVLSAVSAGAVAVWASLDPPIPSSAREWLIWGGLAVLVGFGVVHLFQSIPSVIRQLFAPRQFRNLPREHREKLSAIREREPEATRMKRSVAIYEDLSGKGLIRDVANLASNQAMVRTTPVGGRLAEEWLSEIQSVQSRRDRRLVQDIRAIWDRYGRTPATQVHRLLRDVAHEVKGSLYWSSCLEIDAQALDESIEDLGTVLGTNRSAGEVYSAFNAMYKRYMDALTWLIRMKAHRDIPEEIGASTFSERFERWKENHAPFAHRVKDLSTDPEHKRNLHVFYLESGATAHERPLLVELLSDVEGPLNHPDLRPSGDDT